MSIKSRVYLHSINLLTIVGYLLKKIVFVVLSIIANSVEIGEKNAIELRKLRFIVKAVNLTQNAIKTPTKIASDGISLTFF